MGERIERMMYPQKCNICNGTAFRYISDIDGEPVNQNLCLGCGQTIARTQTVNNSHPEIPFCEKMKTFAQNASEVLKSNTLLVVAFHTDTYDSFAPNQDDDPSHYVAIFPHGQEDQIAAIFQIQNPYGKPLDQITPHLDPLEAFINALTLVGYDVYVHAYSKAPDDAEDVDPETLLFDPLNPPEEYAVILFQDITNVTGKELPKQFDQLVKLQADKAIQAQQKFQEQQRRSTVQQPTPPTPAPTQKVTWEISMTVDTKTGILNQDSYDCQK